MTGVVPVTKTPVLYLTEQPAVHVAAFSFFPPVILFTMLTYMNIIIHLNHVPNHSTGLYVMSHANSQHHSSYASFFTVYFQIICVCYTVHNLISNVYKWAVLL